MGQGVQLGGVVQAMGQILDRQQGLAGKGRQGGHPEIGLGQMVAHRPFLACKSVVQKPGIVAKPGHRLGLDVGVFGCVRKGRTDDVSKVMYIPRRDQVIGRS